MENSGRSIEPRTATVSEGSRLQVIGGPPGPGASRDGEFACPIEEMGNLGALTQLRRRGVYCSPGLLRCVGVAWVDLWVLCSALFSSFWSVFGVVGFGEYDSHPCWIDVYFQCLVGFEGEL